MTLVCAVCHQVRGPIYLIGPRLICLYCINVDDLPDMAQKVRILLTRTRAESARARRERDRAQQARTRSACARAEWETKRARCAKERTQPS